MVSFKPLPSLNWRRILLLALALILVINAFGLLLPETGFDALWYHLPIVRDIAENRQLRYIPDVPQSDQPRLGELLFTPGYLFGGVFGVKLTAFVEMLILLWLTHKLARRYLEPNLSLLLVLAVGSFHTVAWQSSSAYVDLLRTCFELGVFLILAGKPGRKGETWILAVLMLGSLLTKLVSLLFWPALLILVWTRRGSRPTLILAVLTILAVIIFQLPLGFFVTTGRGLIGVPEIFAGLRSFVFLPVTLSFHRESYLSPLFLFAIPLLVHQRQLLWRRYKSELIFLAFSFTAWVFVVPISVRYDLSAIILATILCLYVLSRNKMLIPLSLTVVLAAVVLNTLVRVRVVMRAWPYLVGRQTEFQYLKQYDFGILKGPLEKWYGRSVQYQ